ncbi:MAG: hypothetical protein A2X24_12810 [Chloroflexi bacterium GWB2_54_36]|nr:MAG: hypothetical protein A2X24_12810 [Chloroflexi bacterium GWB2_54_36]
MRVWMVEIALVLLLLSAACQPVPPPVALTATPTVIQTSIPPLQPTPTSQPAGSSPDALKACDLSLQASALRSSTVPDWSTLGIDTCYTLTFDLTSGGPDYSGSARISFTNPGSTALDDLVLRTYPNAPLLYGGQLDVTTAQVNGIDLPVNVFLADRTAVRLPLDQPLEPGETLALDLKFSGKLPIDFGSDQVYGTFNFAGNGPVMLMANAYPLLALLEDGEWGADPVLPEGDAVFSRIALYRVEVRVPAAWQVVSSGREVSRTGSGDRAVIQIAGGPLREFMLAASPAFELERTLWEDITINHWGQPESESSRAEVMQAAVEALSLFSQTFGPLPYNELDIIAAPLNNASGVEYPGLILVGESLYNSRSLPHILPMVTAHEIAHQWWYAVVGNDVLQHPWLDESLATYSAQLYLLNHDPVFYRGALREFRKQVTDLEAEIGVQPLDQSVADLSNLERAYAIVAYLKGNLFFEALREEIGATEFNAALQAYYRENSYQIASPADLLESFEFACTCDLNELFSEWGVQP